MNAPGLVEQLVAFWKDWGVLVMVLTSFSLQVVLLITAEFRRRKDSGALKVVVWLAYLLADTTTIYALGHMSVTVPVSQEQHLSAFWAPFLLLHLGGQDNITAYSIEDNRLWLRHLQSFVVQVLAATYVLYQSSIVARRTLLRPAAILVFVVGVVKYGERVCALRLACSGNLSRKNYQSFFKTRGIDPSPDDADHPAYRIGPDPKIYQAHILLDLPKHLLKGPLPVVEVYGHTSSEWEQMYGVAEMQLSLMHDVLYSKAELIHTWHGYLIRVVSLPAIVAALVLFRRFSEKDGYRREDVATTYVLLVGAVLLEIASVLRAMFSTWTYGKLIMGSHRLFAKVITRMFLHLVLSPVSFRYYVLTKYAMCRGGGGGGGGGGGRGIPTSTRYWSGSMGQHNFIYMCSHCRDGRGSKIARWMEREDWWNMLVYVSSVPVSPDLSELLRKQMKESKDIMKNSEDHIQNSRGRAALKRRPGLYEELHWSVDTEQDESILLWHIATHVFLGWYIYEAKPATRPHHLAQVTEELSNYMMFLLAERPYMLPDNASRQRYVELCNKVINELEYSSEADLITLIRNHGDALLSVGHTPPPAERDGLRHKRNVTFDKACQLGAMLIRKELEIPDANILELISNVWVELLCYAAYRCRPDSHAKQLSNGGEITTLVALMLEYMKTGRRLCTKDV